MNLAEIQVELGKFKEAEENYNKILKKNPKFSEASVGLAQIRIGQGKLEEAMSMVNEALAKGNVGEANYVKGLILYANKMYAEALEQIQAAINNNPNNFKYILARAQINTEIFDFSKAIDDANAVLNKNPESVAARVVMAKAFILSSADEEAEAQLAEIAKKGENADYYKLKGMMAKRQGDEEEAKKNYEKFFEMAGGIPASAFDYAEFLENTEGGVSEAEEVYRAIIKRYPESVYETRAKEAIARLKSSEESSSEDAAYDSKPSNNLRPGSMKY